MNRVESADRRSHKRFSPRSPAFVALGAHGNKIGHITGIGKGSLASNYIDDGTRFNQSNFLDIYSADEGFYLKKVPFTTVSDVELPSEFSLSFITMMRCGIQFDTLTSSQASQVEDFLVNHIEGVLTTAV
jgi:hypothetical protein